MLLPYTVTIPRVFEVLHLTGDTKDTFIVISILQGLVSSLTTSFSIDDVYVPFNVRASYSHVFFQLGRYVLRMEGEAGGQAWYY